jgi:hypothetical protein
MSRCRKMADGGPIKPTPTPTPKPNPMSDQDTPPKGTVPSAPTGTGKEWRDLKKPKFAKGGSVRRFASGGAVRRYDAGGDISLPDISHENVPEVNTDYDSMPFGRAFNQARQLGDTTFKWHGKSFNTRLAGPASMPSPAAVESPQGTVPDFTPTAAEYKASGRSVPQRTNIRFGNPADLAPNERQAMGDVAKMAGVTTLGMLAPPTAALGRAALVAKGARTAGFLTDGTLGQLKSLPAIVRTAIAKDAARAAAKAAATRGRATAGEWTPEMGLGLKKGGSVKGYASGGSVRGSGCETKGKTKGRFVR